MKALVLGGTGQLGGNLVRALLAKGDRVRVLVRSQSRATTLDGLDLERVPGDLNDGDSLRRACDGVRVVYQAASYYPPQTIPVQTALDQALVETRNLLEAVRRASVERLVFTAPSRPSAFLPIPGSSPMKTARSGLCSRTIPISWPRPRWNRPCSTRRNKACPRWS